MAFIGLEVPNEVGRLLSRIEVPGESEDRSNLHITAVYFGSNVPIDEISKAIVVAYEVACRTKPIPLLVEEVGCFPKGDDGVPIIGIVKSPELLQFQEDLCTSFDKANIKYSKKHPIYKPHVCLAYAEELTQPFPVGPFEWSAYEMVLWGGDSGDDKIFITFPFSMPGKEALYRKLVQARVRFPALL
jgi:2'-5' RNA ligase